MRRNSFTNMLGEFVGLQKTPDFRLSSMSNQEINMAVKDEKRSFKESLESMNISQKPRQRYLSEGDIRITTVERVSSEISPNPDGSKDNVVQVVMRNKKLNESVKTKERPTSLIERIRKKINHTKTGAIYESDEEKDDCDNSFTRRRDSTRSERLFIPITPVEGVPIRIVQVSN